MQCRKARPVLESMRFVCEQSGESRAGNRGSGGSGDDPSRCRSCCAIFIADLACALVGWGMPLFLQSLPQCRKTSQGNGTSSVNFGKCDEIEARVMAH